MRQVNHLPRGRVVSFTDLDGLHAAIGRLIVTERRRLSGPEVRFRRHELNLGQAEVAGLLGVAERTVARWEKDDIEIPVTADATLRAMYREHLHEEPAVTQSLRTMRAIEGQDHRRLDLIEITAGTGPPDASMNDPTAVSLAWWLHEHGFAAPGITTGSRDFLGASGIVKKAADFGSALDVCILPPQPVCEGRVTPGQGGLPNGRET